MPSLATRAALDTFAETNTLIPWQAYATDDEDGRLAIATGPNTYSVAAMIDEDGNVASASGFIVGGQRVVAGRQAGIASPTAGPVEDAEARDAIDSILAALSAHGLIE